MSRALLIGGLGALRDELVVAALAGAGVEAVALPPPSDAGLARARAFGNHGQCNPALYPVGAVLEAADAAGAPADFARRHAWVVPASCGPCRLAAFPLEWRRVLDGAGLGALSLETVSQHALMPALERTAGGRGAGFGVVMALLAGDGLEALGQTLRPWVDDAEALEALLRAGARAAGAALVERRSPVTALADVGARAWALPLRAGRVLPRVVVVGEPWTTLTDGAPSFSVVRRLARLGAEVEAPLVVDWLAALSWERSQAARLPEVEQRSARGAARTLAAAWRLVAAALRLPVRRASPARLAALARPWYPPEVRGGSSFLELGHALAAAEARRAHLVLSLKPFGCLPSALSDGVLGPVLARRAGAPAFLALETSGDGYAAADSRLELALHGATLRAWQEFEDACRARGWSTEAGLEAVGRHGGSLLRAPATGRRFACGAAEAVARGLAQGG